MAYPSPTNGQFNSPAFQQFLAAHPTFAEAARDSRRSMTRFLDNHPKIRRRYMALVAPPSPSRPAAPAMDPVVQAPTASAPQMSAADTNWIDELTTMFRENGLETLATALTGLVQEGHQGPALRLKLQDTDAYRQRFAANDARRKAGLPVLSPAEYLAAEGQFRQVMQTAGLPKGFYDDAADFQKFLENDTSPAEVNERVQGAVQLASRTDPAYRKMLQDEFGIGLTDSDIAAYLLDQTRALPLLKRQVESVGIADAARRQGLQYSAERADQLAQLGVTSAEAQQAYGQIADATDTFGRAAGAFGLEYDQDEAEDELLLGSSDARRKRQAVETTFGANNPGTSSRKSSRSLSSDTSGSF